MLLEKNAVDSFFVNHFLDNQQQYISLAPHLSKKNKKTPHHVKDYYTLETKLGLILTLDLINSKTLEEYTHSFIDAARTN